MTSFLKKTALGLCLSISLSLCIAQEPDDAPQPYGALPSARQLLWHETEMYCLIHFTPTTYQDKEWGYGDADPGIFNPKHFDAEQIVAAAKAGGFKGIITVAKHHDGFALWPTKTAAYNISESPWRDGKGDLVKEFQEATQKLGLKFGVYCSPWDRNNPSYGTPAYLEIYRNQLKELYSNYGELFMSWHDGANGGDGYYGGKKEQRRVDQSIYYDWPNTWAITREMQPNASIFSDVGPDARWVGNEKGIAPETSWSTITPIGIDGKPPMPGFLDDSNLGSGDRDGKYWIPTECDVPLRPGWFYHAAQDDQVKSVATLFDLYCKSVGRGGAFDLGLAPNKDGLLHERDVETLREFGELLEQVFSENLAAQAKITANNIRHGNDDHYGVANLIDADRYSYWATNDEETKPELVLALDGAKEFNIIQIRENIKLGQRIDSVLVSQWHEGQWKALGKATSIGANRLIRLAEPVSTNQVKLQFFAPVAVAVSEIGLYIEPEGLQGNNLTIKDFGLPAADWKIKEDKGVAALDRNPATFWESDQDHVVIDLGSATAFSAFGYLPRQDGNTAGIIQHYEFAYSNDGKKWTKAASGEFSNIRANPIMQKIDLGKTVRARYVRLKAVQAVKADRQKLAIAELMLYN